jgi:HSP20 family protein
MVKITNEKRLPSTMRNPWLEPFFLPWVETPGFGIDMFSGMDAALDQFAESFERMGGFFPSYMRTFPKDISCDLVDKGDKFVLTADLPGIENDEVKVNVTGRRVEISAEHKSSKEEKSKDYIRNERSSVKYQRILTAPERISESAVTANVSNGVLTVELPKKNIPKKDQPSTQVKSQ